MSTASRTGADGIARLSAVFPGNLPLSVLLYLCALVTGDSVLGFLPRRL
jgi:hypothetical protein